MSALRLLLDDASGAGAWGDSLKMLVIMLVMVVVGIGAVVWWIRRG
jgi:hypothetical protein